MRPKLLAVELWALGDVLLATRFLNAAAQRFDVTLLAKPAALELQPRLWPGVEVIPFVFPWTAFQGKYQLHRWPWRELTSLLQNLRARRFDLTVSARWDPRDHLLLRLIGAPVRVGFPYRGSALFLTAPLPLPPGEAHRHENWRSLARHLGFELPPPDAPVAPLRGRRSIVIHSGARQRTKVWPLDRFQAVAASLRRAGYPVQIACDPAQREWWIARGEKVSVTATITELITVLDTAALLIGNDSGPGHLAGIMGIPTFTLFGNQFAFRFAPLHPQAEWIEGAACPYKPCHDNCRFANPECLYSIAEKDALPKVLAFAAKHLPPSQ